MSKAYRIDSDEMYPVYEIMDSGSWLVELSDYEKSFIDEAFRNFYLAQDILRAKVGDSRG